VKRTAFLVFLVLTAILAGSMAVSDRGSSSTPALVAQTRDALRKRQWNRAEALLLRLSNRQLPLADRAALEAELEFGRGRPEEAVRRLASIPEADPAASRARMVAGQVLRRLHQARRAEAHLRDAIRLDPGLLEARKELVLILAAQGRRSEVAEQFQAIAQLRPLAWEEALLWTATLEDIWINDTIRTELERFVAADPDDRFSRLALAAVNLREGDLERAEHWLDPIAASDPESVVLRARIALERGDLEALQQLIREGPDENAEVCLLRGQLAARLGDPEAAMGHFREALRIDPTRRDALQGLSLALRQLGRSQEAAVYQEQAERWRMLTQRLQQAQGAGGKRDSVLLREIGETCESLARLPEAVSWYRLAIAADPLDAKAQAALKRLEPAS